MTKVKFGLSDDLIKLNGKDTKFRGLEVDVPKLAHRGVLVEFSGA